MAEKLLYYYPPLTPLSQQLDHVQFCEGLLDFAKCVQLARRGGGCQDHPAARGPPPLRPPHTRGMCMLSSAPSQRTTAPPSGRAACGTRSYSVNPGCGWYLYVARATRAQVAVVTLLSLLRQHIARS